MLIKNYIKKAKYDALKLVSAKKKLSLMKNSKNMLANQKNYGTL